MKRILFLLLTLCVGLGLELGKLAQNGLFDPGTTLHVLDIGQGDALLLTSPERHRVLIDGGPGRTVLTELGKVLPMSMREIDLLVVTHPHLDHIEGLYEVLKRYRVKAVLMTLPVYESEAYDALLAELEGVPVHIADDDEDFRLGSLLLDVLYPFEPIVGESLSNVNNASVVIRASVLDNSALSSWEPGLTDEPLWEQSVLLTGDAEHEVEEELLEKFSFDSNGETKLGARILKAGHHGSRTSSSSAFLDQVKPELLLISAGEGNSFGHPHPETLEKAATRRIKVLRTDKSGRIKVRL